MCRCRRRAVLAYMACLVSMTTVGMYMLMPACNRPEACGLSWRARGVLPARGMLGPAGSLQQTVLHVRARARRFLFNTFFNNTPWRVSMLGRADTRGGDGHGAVAGPHAPLCSGAPGA